MLREYKNKRIYKNLKVVYVLSIIALCLSVLAVTAFLLHRYLGDPSTRLEIGIPAKTLFYVFTIFIPLGFILNCARWSKKSPRKLTKENKLNNDFTNILSVAIMPFLPIICLFVPTFAFCLGCMLPASLLLYISSGFLIHNCVLIKREWKNAPPVFVIEEQIEQGKAEKEKRKKQIKTANRTMETCRTLINKCGARFFIKYYRQIKHLPPRDVTVTEMYSPQEKEERISAAKQIIDLGLTAFAMEQIRIQYREFLNETEIESAKSIIEELKDGE